MQMNVGGIDRLVRITIGTILFFGPLLKFWNQFVGPSIFFGVLLMATGLSGFCGLYFLLGINTCKNEYKILE